MEESLSKLAESVIKRTNGKVNPDELIAKFRSLIDYPSPSPLPTSESSAELPLIPQDHREDQP